VVKKLHRKHATTPTRCAAASLLQSVRSLWYLMSNLLAMHADHQNWIVNPMREMNIRAMVDQDDLDIYPGKIILSRQAAAPLRAGAAGEWRPGARGVAAPRRAHQPGVGRWACGQTPAAAGGWSGSRVRGGGTRPVEQAV